ncbi:MAG: hypothetical protein Q9220_002829 [cf. Caloplaca sp. 1 TL-2023]
MPDKTLSAYPGLLWQDCIFSPSLDFALYIVRSQDSTTTGTSTEQSSVIQSSSLPLETEPLCLEPRGEGDPSGPDISQALSSDNSVSKACNVETQAVDTIGQLTVISYGFRGYFFNISHNVNAISRPIASPNLCPDTFNAILAQCVSGTGTFWGGYNQGGIANYSITNHLYPENPLLASDQGSQTTELPSSTTNFLPTTTTDSITTGGQTTTTETGQITASGSSTNSQISDIASNTNTLTGDTSSTTTTNTDTMRSSQHTDTKTDTTASADSSATYTTINTSTLGNTQNTGSQTTTGQTTGSQTTGNEDLTRTTNNDPSNSGTARDTQTSSTGSTTQATLQVLPSGATVIISTEYDDIVPPIPDIVGPMPDIVVNDDLVPSAKEDPEDEKTTETRSTESEPTKTSASTSSTDSSCTSSTVVQDCEVLCASQSASTSCSTTCISSTVSCSGHGTTTTSTETGACERPSGYSSVLAPVTEPSKGLGKGSILLPGGGSATGASRTGVSTTETGTRETSTTTNSGASSSTLTSNTAASTEQGGQTTGVTSSTFTTSRTSGTNTLQDTSGSITSTTSIYTPPAWQCPNDGVRQNAPGCPTPSTSTGGPLRCSTGSNLGAAIYDPKTWCGCNGDIYSTISGATSDYCAYSTVPASTIRPTQVPNPYPFTTTNMQNGEVVACATSSVDVAKSSTACDGKSTIVSTVTSIAVAASASAAAAKPTADCDFWDEVLYWNFEVYNINGWAGDGGASLHQQEGGCKGLTGWEWHVDNDRYQHAYFNLPFTIKSGCVERAIKSAGGPEGLSCTGHGLKKRSKSNEQTEASKPLKARVFGKRSEHRFSTQSLEDEANYAESHNISQRAIIPRAHTASWTKYAPKGIQYYNEWKNRPATQDDKPALCDFDSTYDFSYTPFAVTEPFPNIKPYINGPKGQTYTNFRWHWPKGPTNQATAIFWNNISPVDNVIVAFSNDRGGDADEGEDPSPDNWSDMLWWLWLRATADGAGDKAALSQIFRYNVDNEASKEILEEVLGDKVDEVVTLEPDEAQDADGNGFWALLGCPNGTGMIHLVGDHKMALGGKGVKSISCVYDGREDQYYMWGNLG